MGFLQRAAGGALRRLGSSYAASHETFPFAQALSRSFSAAAEHGEPPSNEAETAGWENMNALPCSLLAGAS